LLVFSTNTLPPLLLTDWTSLSPENALVYDLGGFTFDVSVRTIDNGVFEVLPLLEIDANGILRVSTEDKASSGDHHHQRQGTFVARGNRAHGC
jgi:molecular chaperone DnaK (HSP70)